MALRSLSGPRTPTSRRRSLAVAAIPSTLAACTGGGAIGRPSGVAGSGTVVVSTHLDDAVFSCYGVLGPGVVVVTVFAGIPPGGVLGEWDRATGAAESRPRVLERRLEDREALRLTGAEPVHLDFAEDQHAATGVVARPTQEELCSVLDGILAAATTVYAPAGIGHPEHERVRDAVLASRRDACLYVDLPYALRSDTGFRLPAGVAQQPRERRDRLLDPATAAEKVEACRCYASQLPALTALHGDFVAAARLAREVTWLPCAHVDR